MVSAAAVIRRRRRVGDVGLKTMQEASRKDAKENKIAAQIVELFRHAF